MKNQIFLGVAILVVFCAALTQAQWTPDPFCPYPSDEVTKYPYYGNCSLWWECFQGSKYPMECPEGLEFNAPLQQCDDPSIANCDPFASTTSNPNRTTISTTPSVTTPLGGPDCSGVGDTPVYYPYEGDCSKYWECWKGDAYLFSCPEGLWWNPTQEKCTEPGAFCQGTTDNPTTIHHDQPDCSGTTDSVYYPYDGDCTKYWECADGELYLNGCPDGQWWHQSINSCDTPGSYCDNSSTSIGTTPSVTTQIGGPDCSGVGDTPVYYPYEGDCSKYWECWRGDSYLFSCPAGLWWDPTQEECAEPGNFCEGTTENPTTIHTDQPDCTGTTDSVYYPFDGDCSKYWECADGELYLNGCPDGQWWHQSISECDTPGSYCDSSSKTRSEVSASIPGLPDCTGTTDPVYYPFDGDCTKFWECTNGALFLNSCPEDLWWNQELQMCQNPGPFCDNSTIITTTTISPTQGPMCTGGPDDLPFYPYPGDCTRYYECSDGFLYLYTCPGGMWWHQETSNCEEPGDYCEEYSTTWSTATTPFQCSANGTSYWPDPNDCHMYVECIDGTPYAVECPPGLYYSESQKLCVSKEESECCSQQTCEL